MKAKLIYHEKFMYADGAVREMVLWQLPKKTYDRPGNGMGSSLRLTLVVN
jgi:hypothetical protein